jgi:hypothetical protein
MDKEARERVDSVIRRVITESEAVVTATTTQGVAAQQRLLRLLDDADALLAKRIQAWLRATNAPERFTAESLLSYRRQIQLMTASVRDQLAGVTRANARSAWNIGIAQAQVDFARLEQAFTGIVRTPRVREALRFDESRGRARSLLRSIDTSCDRYGEAMIGEYERRLQLGMVAGLSNQDMVEMLTSHGGPVGEVSLRARVVNGQVVRIATETIPEGLFVRYRSWAWRIVRTESANAYNGARMERMQSMEDEFPEMKKKILAHFDSRTAEDSIAVHGQIRDVSGANSLFRDGAGREYEHPPARPNDRETVIPWMDDWEETRMTRQLTPEEQERAVARAKREAAAADVRRESPEHARARALVDRLAGRRRAAGAGAP